MGLDSMDIFTVVKFPFEDVHPKIIKEFNISPALKNNSGYTLRPNDLDYITEIKINVSSRPVGTRIKFRVAASKFEAKTNTSLVVQERRFKKLLVAIKRMVVKLTGERNSVYYLERVDVAQDIKITESFFTLNKVLELLFDIGNKNKSINFRSKGTEFKYFYEDKGAPRRKSSGFLLHNSSLELNFYDKFLALEKGRHFKDLQELQKVSKGLLRVETRLLNQKAVKYYLGTTDLEQITLSRLKDVARKIVYISILEGIERELERKRARFINELEATRERDAFFKAVTRLQDDIFDVDLLKQALKNQKGKLDSNDYTRLSKVRIESFIHAGKKREFSPLTGNFKRLDFIRDKLSRR